MLSGFKTFIMRGNVVDLAIGVVIGAAFSGVVNSLVKDVITPIIAAIFKQPDFSSIAVTVNGSAIMLGSFLNSLLSFVIVAAAIYYLVVLPLNKLMARAGAKSQIGINQPKAE